MARMMKDDEEALISKVQDCFGDVKNAAEAASVALKRISKITRENGDLRAANDAMIVQGYFDAILSEARKGHGIGSNALLDHYEDGGKIIAKPKGGGGR